MTRLTKTEGGVEYPARCFLDLRDPKKPSTWSLRTHELVHGNLEITHEQLNKAASALLSYGYMGNQNKAQQPGSSFEKLRRDLVSKYREAGIPDNAIPKGLLPKDQPLPSKYSKHKVNMLEHSGVKGMKWGIRRDLSTSGQKLTTKAKKMSSEDLKNRISRLQMERQYADLISRENQANQTRLSRGKDAVVKAMKEAGQEQMKNVFSKSINLGLTQGTKAAANGNPNLRAFAMIFDPNFKPRPQGTSG